MIWLLLLGCPAPEAGFELAADGVPGGTLLAGWSDGEDVLFVGGDLGPEGTGMIARVVGDTLCVEADAASAPLWWAHGAAAGRYLAVGARGTVLAVTDGEVNETTLPTDATLFGVWDAGDDAWAVGSEIGAGTGELWRRSGGVWALADTLDTPLFKVWGRWIAGDGVVRWRDDAGTWIDRTPAGAPRLLTIRGRADDDVYAVGGTSGPELWHWDGSVWTEIDVDPHCAYNALNGLWTAPGEDVWVAALFGGMGKRDDTGWTCPDGPLTTEHLHAAWRHGEDTWFVGGNLLTAGGNHGTLVRHGVPAGMLSVDTTCRAR